MNEISRHSAGEGDSGAQWLRVTRYDLAVLALVAVTYLLVYPVGEYAILDDWAYMKSLEHLHFEGEFRILDWNPMSLVGHLVWGLLFTKAFGFSFTAAKLSVVAAHALECLVILRILRMAGVRPGLALAAVVTVMVQPLHLAHCYMFMTDVPTITWQWVALGLALLGLKSSGSRSLMWFAAGSLFAGFAFTTRQHGIFVTPAVVAYLLFGARGPRRWGAIAASVIPAACICTGFLLWYRFVHGPTRTFETSSQAVMTSLLNPPFDGLPFISFTFIVYIGLFCAPLMLSLKRREAGPLPAAAVCGMAALGWFVIYEMTLRTLQGIHFPFIRNVVTRWGFFQPDEFIVGDRAVIWGPSIAIAIGIVGTYSGYRFIELLLRARPWSGLRIRRPALPDAIAGSGDPTALSRAHVVGIVFVLVLLQLFYLIATAPFLFDRHLIIILPGVVVLAVLMAADSVRWRPAPFVAVALSFGLYGIAGSQEIHSVSRAIYQAGEDLHASGVPIARIDAGYAFDGWHMYEQTQDETEVIPVPPWWPQTEIEPPPIQHPWWVSHLIPGVQPEYIVSLTPEIPTYLYGGEHDFVVVRDDLRCREFWPWKERPVYVLRNRRFGIGEEDEAAPPSADSVASVLH